MPSTMSSSTTSKQPASTRRWAVVPPTFPAPTTVIFSRATGSYLPLGSESTVRYSTRPCASPAVQTSTLTPILTSMVVVLVRTPTGDLKIDGAHEIFAQIEIQLDLFLSVGLVQELLRAI